MSLRRGTTPTIHVDVDVDLTGYPRVVLTIKDKEGTLTDFEKNKLTVTPQFVEATLTQEQTLAMKPGVLKIQIRAVSPSGKAVATDIMESYIDPILKDEVI